MITLAVLCDVCSGKIMPDWGFFEVKKTDSSFSVTLHREVKGQSDPVDHICSIGCLVQALSAWWEPNRKKIDDDDDF